MQQHVGLAGNPIVGVRHLSGLRGLPSLMELTLDDIHFGTCPVVTKEGYRHFVMCCLRHVCTETDSSPCVSFWRGTEPAPLDLEPSRLFLLRLAYLTLHIAHEHAHTKTGPVTFWFHLWRDLWDWWSPLPPLEAGCHKTINTMLVAPLARPTQWTEDEGPKPPC